MLRFRAILILVTPFPESKLVSQTLCYSICLSLPQQTPTAWYVQARRSRRGIADRCEELTLFKVLVSHEFLTHAFSPNIMLTPVFYSQTSHPVRQKLYGRVAHVGIFLANSMEFSIVDLPVAVESSASSVRSTTQSEAYFEMTWRTWVFQIMVSLPSCNMLSDHWEACRYVRRYGRGQGSSKCS